jgi:hypothetical protein
MFLEDRERITYFLIAKAILMYEYMSLMRSYWNKMKDFGDTCNDIEVSSWDQLTEHVDILMKIAAYKRQWIRI